jgi:hypothetical protein
MQDIFETLIIILLIIAFLFGFKLFIQLMSKLSGKQIETKYSRQTISSPDDLDKTVKTLKGVTEDISFHIKKMKLNNVEQIVYKLDKILIKNPGLPFRNYVENKLNFESLVTEIVSEGKITQKELLQRMNLPGIIYDGIVDRKTYDKLSKYRITYEIDIRTFNQSDFEKIESFMLPSLNYQTDKLFEFLDLLGRPNFKEFASVIDLIEKMYLSSKISKKEIDNIKLLVLRKKGMLKTII